MMFLTFAFSLKAQQVHVSFENIPLKEVLLELKSEYDLQFSFHDEIIADCIVNDSNQYSNEEEAIAAYLKPCDLTYQLIDDVFIIQKNKQIVKEKRLSKLLFKAKIIDQENQEGLPFCSVQINDQYLITDINGNFSYQSTEESLSIRISHLGYFGVDTLCNYDPSLLIFSLTPKVIGLETVLISAQKINSEIPLLSAKQNLAGLLKINHKIASFLPGNRGNTLFNLLRLQSGILAAGEQSNDFIIWGSYKGQTQIIFDGISLFTSSNLNDEIGIVNALMTKDVEVYKGGYQVDIGDRVGGVVNITGFQGDRRLFHGDIDLNNQMAIGKINIPIAGKSALQLAFRKSYFDFLNWNNLKEEKKQSEEIDFADLNAKLSVDLNNGDEFHVSFLAAKDEVNEVRRLVEEGKEYFDEQSIEHTQIANSIFYNKKWQKGGLTNIGLTYSNLKVRIQNNLKIISPLNEVDLLDDLTNNDFMETTFKISHHFPTTKRHRLLTGINFVRNSSTFNQVNIKETIDKVIDLNRVNFFIKDDFRINKQISIEPGLKLDFMLNPVLPFVQPRLQIKYNPTPYWNINLAYGIYRQFIDENAIVDDLNNFLFFWNIADSDKNVVKSDHYVMSIQRRFNSLDCKAELYYKDMNDLSRYRSKDGVLALSKGKARSFGLDVSLHKKIARHQISMAYSLSKTEELFDYFSIKEYSRAPQDQRHEFKMVGMFNFNPFFFSFNYIYGSGISNSTNIISSDKIPAYNRLDVSFLYKIKTKKINYETGLSIVNVLNQENIRYNNFANFPDNKTNFSYARSFNPTLFFSLSF